MILFNIILGTAIISLISLVGIFTLSLGKKIDNFLDILVSASIGALIGGAFLHLIPEALGKSNYNTVFLFVILGFLIFFLIEKVFHWRHCHDRTCKVHSFAYMSLYGDAVHNFIDGLIIAASFIASPGLGITSLFAIALHEIPQEISDFGVLVYGGMKKKTALFFNFITALTAVVGGILGFFLFSHIQGTLIFLISIAAGGFIYISASDLIPEIRKETKISRSILHIVIIILGIIAMALIRD